MWTKTMGGPNAMVRFEEQAMQAWLIAQNDYFLLWASLSFICLAAIFARSMGRKSSVIWLPANWLMAASICLAIWEWLGILQLAYPAELMQERLRFFTGMVAFCALFAGAWRHLRLMGSRSFVQAHIFPLCLVVFGVMAWGFGLVPALYISLGLPALFWMSFIFWRSAYHHTGTVLWALRIASLMLAGYAIALVGPQVLPLVYPAQSTGAGALADNRLLGFDLARSLFAGQVVLWVGIWSSSGTVASQRRSLSQQLLLSFGLSLLFICGWMATERRGSLYEQEMRDAVLREARYIAHAIDPLRAKDLLFTKEDATNPAYHALRRQMIGYTRAFGPWNTYTLAERNGVLIFGPESLEVNSPFASPPGTVYEQPDPAFWAVCRMRGERVIGPYTDEYGTFVAGAASVCDPQTGEVIMAVGVDILADQWKSHIVVARLSPMLFVSLLTILFVGADALLAWRKRLPEHQRGRWPYAEAVLAGVVGIVITIMAAKTINDISDRSRRSDFFSLTDAQSQVIRDAFNRAMRDVEYVAHFYESSDLVTHGEFSQFTRQLLDLSPVQGVAWIPRVRMEDREAFEEHIREGGDVDFQIHNPGALPPAPEADALHAYFPVTYLSEPSQSKQLVGLNVVQFPEMPSAIAEAAETGESVCVFLPSINYGGQTTQILILHPILEQGSRQLKGLISGLITPNRLLEWSVSFQGYNQALLNISLADLLADVTPVTFATFPIRDIPPAIIPSSPGPFELRALFPIFVANRSWGIQLMPAQEFIRQHRDWAEVITFMSGLGVVGIVAAFLVFLQRRQSDLERQVTIRTLEARLGEERMRLIVESSPLPLLVSELDSGSILIANQAFLDLFGCDHERLSTLTTPELYPDPELRHSVLSELRREGYVIHFESRMRKANGIEFPVMLSIRPIPYEGQDVMLTIISDLTERKRTEEALRRRVSRTRRQNEVLNLIAMLPAMAAGEIDDVAHSVTELGAEALLVERGGLWLFNETETELRCLDYFEADRKTHSTGLIITEDKFPNEFQLARTSVSIVIDDVVTDSRVRAILSPVLSPMGISSLLCAIIRGSGKTLGVLAYGHARAIHRWEPDEIAFACQLADQIALTLSNHDRRIAQEALRDHEELLHGVITAARDAIVMMGHKGQVMLWSPGAEKILGWTAEEAMGQNIHQLMAPPRFHAQSTAAFPAFQRSGKGEVVGKTIELPAIHKDGHEIPIELSLSAFQHQGEWCALGILRDITERKRVEAELLDSRNQIEQALIKANQLTIEAEKANAAKSEFLANMSHEIRTPMNGVIGMTTLLLDTVLNEEQRQYVDTIRNSGEALLSIINDILDFSKIEAGRMDLESIDFDLRATVAESMDVMAIKAEEKAIELLCLVNPDVPSGLRGDPGRLRQVLVNLVSNAIKFTDAGEVALRIALDEMTDAQVRLIVAITDTGIGIRKERQAAIFDAFTQADGSTTRRFGGTGLGLAICKRIVTMMDGEIGVESEEGRGSSFWFTARFDRQAHTDTAPLPAPVKLEGVRALIIDDNQTNREILRIQLTAWGCLCQEMENGLNAIEELRRASQNHEPYDLALCDMLMPVMDGMALAEKVHEDPLIKDTTLILLSSVAQRGDASRAREKGFSAYLTKPVLRQEVLRACLERALSNRNAGQQLEGAAPPLITAHTLAGDFRRAARVLVAEDNVINQRVARGMLERLGLRVDCVSDGQEAVAAVSSVPYDLVFMDCQKPRMDGYEATAAIRALDSPIRKIPIIAMTAHAMKTDREKCMAAGMDGYIPKPIRPEDLAQELGRLLPAHLHGVPVADAPGSSSSALSAAHASEVFSPEGFMARIGGNQAIARDVLSLALKEIPRVIQLWESALNAEDATSAARHAHSLKGAASNIDASLVRAAAAEGEAAARAGQMAAAREAWQKTGYCAKDLAISIQHFLDSLDNLEEPLS